MNMHGTRARATFAALVLSTLALATACSGYIGYGVVNWSVPEHSLVAGDVIPVFIQSNIGKVYVVGAGPDRKERVELPLWQITLYKSASKARKAAAAFGDYRYLYATAKVDGLPVRAQPDNTARQVYRLREGQKLRIVASGEGAPVLAGNAPLEGEWLSVLTDDGSVGWCFSYNLEVYDERAGGEAGPASAESGPDAVLDSILSRAWLPDYYRAMIDSGRVDISRIRPQWGFFPGKDSLVARIELADGVVSFPYTSIVKVGEKSYRFEGSTLTLDVRRDDTVFAQYTDANGMPQSYFFVSLDTTPEDLIEAERARRAGVIESIRSAGPSFVSGNYGAVRFLSGDAFLWSGYQLLTPAIIPAGSGGGGSVEARYFLHETVSSEYDGSLTFTFESNKAQVTFLFDIGPQGLKLEQVSPRNIKDSVIISRNLTPTVIFLTPDAAQGER